MTKYMSVKICNGPNQMLGLKKVNKIGYLRFEAISIEESYAVLYTAPTSSF